MRSVVFVLLLLFSWIFNANVCFSEDSGTSIPLVGGRSFVPEDNSFVVTFPQGFTSVEKSSKLASTDNGPIETVSYRSQTPRGTCLVNVSDYPVLPLKPESRLDEVEGETLIQRVLETKRTWSDRGLLKKSFLFHHTVIDEFGQSLLILDKKRVYAVSCLMVSEQERDRKQIQDFFLSFQLNARPKRKKT